MLRYLTKSNSNIMCYLYLNNNNNKLVGEHGDSNPQYLGYTAVINTSRFNHQQVREIIWKHLLLCAGVSSYGTSMVAEHPLYIYIYIY